MHYYTSCSSNTIAPAHSAVAPAARRRCMVPATACDAKSADSIKYVQMAASFHSTSTAIARKYAQCSSKNANSTRRPRSGGSFRGARW